MGPGGAPIRQKDRDRFLIMQDIGCIACLIKGIAEQPCQIHHIVSCGKRVGGKEQHQHTLGLCEWHHQGQTRAGYSPDEMANMIGPSLDRQKRKFVEVFGDEIQLLELQDRIIAERRQMH